MNCVLDIFRLPSGFNYRIKSIDAMRNLDAMRKLSVILVLFLAGALFAVPCAATPRAVFVDSVFEFSPLPDGVKITHEFSVRNTGDTTLNIIKVLPP